MYLIPNLINYVNQETNMNNANKIIPCFLKKINTYYKDYKSFNTSIKPSVHFGTKASKKRIGFPLILSEL